MKQWVDELSRINGINKLGSDSVNFQIVDFTKFGDPNILWRTAMSQIPEIEKVNISQKGKGFNDFYPGKVMVIIGPQNIPDNVQLDGFGRVSKLAPTIFIQRKNVEFARMNPIVKMQLPQIPQHIMLYQIPLDKSYILNVQLNCMNIITTTLLRNNLADTLKEVSGKKDYLLVAKKAK